MTDKEKIIIDKLNVGQCKFLSTYNDCDGYHYYCDLADDIKNEYCDHYKDCYFKKLARKTAECEKYEQALDEIEKKCCAVLNGNERILHAYQIRDIINKARKQ